MQYDDYLKEKSCKAANIYNEATRNNIFITFVDPSISLSFREYRATYSEAKLTDIAFKESCYQQSKKETPNPAYINNQSTSRKQYETRTWKKPSAHAIKIGSTILPTWSSQHR